MTPVLLVVLGCSSDGVAIESVVVRDSAGVRIVENLAPRWADGLSGWTVDPIPAIEIRGDFGEPEYYLFEVRGVVRGSDRSIVVANQGTSQLFLFDSLGVFVGVEGRPGDGPGEFQALFGLFRCGRDTLLVMERSRISVLDGAGRFLRTVPKREEFTAVSPDCNAGLSAVSVFPRPQLVPGVNDLQVTLFWRAFEDGGSDTITTAVWDQAYIWERDGTIMAPWLPFAEKAVWAASGDDVIVGHGVSFELEVFERSGRLRQLLRWKATRSPLTRQDRDDVSETLFEHPEYGTEFGPVERLPLPDAKPAYTKIVSDGEGSIWVQQAGKWPEHSTGWWLFDSGGRWLGSVEMPENLRILAIDDDFVIGVFRDESDVENVRLHRINKPAF